MQQSDSTIERWVLDVGRWAFAPLVKMDSPSRNILWRIVALVVGGVFIYVGVIKAMDPVQAKDENSVRLNLKNKR